MANAASRGIAALFLLILMVTVVTPPAIADLDDFRQDVEEEEERNRGEGDDSQESPSGEDDDGANPFAQLLYEITIFAWTLHNTAVFYADFPYADRPAPAGVRPRGFVHFDLESIRIEEDFSITRVGPRRKRHWFEVRSGVLSSSDYTTYGAMASLQGRFTPFFGPDVDTRFIADGEDFLNITTAGLDMSILQHDYFTWSLYGKWAGFRGILERNGGAMGTQVHSYLFNPVSLRLRAGAVVFPNITFAQLEGSLAVHLNRIALFGGAMLLQSDSSHILSLETGASVSF
ncbi:MAG: hypothetical protein GVY23_08050 [Spirochaetes bacterium]|jgi:hypothetical protein|nr:hypothetical protein [Spirochaetota bacterium]